MKSITEAMMKKPSKDPRARSPKTGRLMERKRRDKLRDEKFGVMPKEMREEAPAKKKTTKPKAQRGKKAETEIEGTQVMQEKLPKKKNTGIKAKEGRKPVKEDIVGAQVMQEPAKPKASAKKIVETTANNRKEGKGQGVTPFRNKPAQKARERNKNPKKAKVNEGNEAAAKPEANNAKRLKKKR